MDRKIIHIDMDAFFASVEQRDNPELRGIPVAVGHASKGGVVAAASYEARKYGVRSAMPSLQAMRKCPGLRFVLPRFEVYKDVSSQMHEIFHEYTDVIEPISLDEAFLDVSENKPGIPMAVTIAREIKAKIAERLHLVASAGVSYNKFLAKIASDYRKPNGLCTIHPSVAQKFIDALSIEQFWGVGPVTAEHMHRLGIHSGADLRALPIERLVREFGKMGPVYYQFARGIDLRPVASTRIRKSVGCETTLEEFIRDDEQFRATAMELANELEGRLDRRSFTGATITLKIRYADFTTRTRSLSLPMAPERWTAVDIMASAMKLYAECEPASGSRQIRLVGLTVSNPPGLERSGDDDSWAYPDIWPRQLEIDFEREY